MLLAKIESSLNRNLAASSTARGLCARLAGKSLRVSLTGLSMDFVVRSEGEQLRLAQDSTAAADATLSGTPLDLLSLVRQQSSNTLSGSGVQIAGNAEVAQGFSELLKQVKPDLEEELSRVVGDVAAHQLGNTARSLLGFGKRMGNTLLQNVGEYLSEESRDVPSKTEVEEFNREVDVLRDDVDRLAARLSQYERTHRQ